MRILLLITAMFFSLNALATKVFVLKATGAGVSEGNLSAITELVESAVSEAGDYQMTDNRWKADFELRPKLTKLGSSYIMTLYKSKDSKTLIVKKMKSTNIEDMDTVASRLVRAVLKNENVKSNSKVYEVTKDEQEKRNRRYKAHKQYVFGFGAGWANDMNESGTSTTLTFGKLWNIDERFDLGLIGEYAFTPSGSDSGFADLSVDFNYFLTDDASSAFLIGGIGYGFASAHVDESSTLIGSNDNASGFALKVGAGMRFFRSSTVNFGFITTYSQLMSKTKETDMRPGLLSANLIIYYE